MSAPAIVIAQDDTVPLTDAALMLGIGYHQCRDRVLKGELRGGRWGAHWFCLRSAVEAAVAEQKALTANPGG